MWLPMPLSWERHAPTVASLIAEIQVRSVQVSEGCDSYSVVPTIKIINGV